MAKYLIFSLILFFFGFISAEVLMLTVQKRPYVESDKAKTSIVTDVAKRSTENPFYERATKNPLVHDEAIKHLIEAEIPWIESLQAGNEQKVSISYDAEGVITEAYKNIQKKSFVITIQGKTNEKIMHYALKDSEKNRSTFLYYKKGSKNPSPWEEIKVGSRVRFTERWNLHQYPIIFAHSIIEL